MTALRLWFGVSLLLSAFAMKYSSIRAAGLPPDEARSAWWSPVLSVASWRKRQPVDSAAVRDALLALTGFAALVVPAWWLYQRLAPITQQSTIARGYLAVIPFYLFAESLSALAALILLLTGWRYPAYLRLPIMARTVDEFWGRRWGTWVADWLRQLVLARHRHRHLKGLCAVFVISGIWHEVIIDTPYYIFDGGNVMGRWLMYFLIQAVGILGERTLFRRRNALSRMYALAVIVVPAPLALNEATLRLVGLS